MRLTGVGFKSSSLQSNRSAILAMLTSACGLGGEHLLVTSVMSLLNEYGRDPAPPGFLDGGENAQFVVDEDIVIRRIPGGDVGQFALLVHIDQCVLSTSNRKTTLPERSGFVVFISARGASHPREARRALRSAA